MSKQLILLTDLYSKLRNEHYDPGSQHQHVTWAGNTQARRA